MNAEERLVLNDAILAIKTEGIDWWSTGNPEPWSGDNIAPTVADVMAWLAEHGPPEYHEYEDLQDAAILCYQRTAEQQARGT